MNRRHAAKVSRVERLEQVECFGAADLTHDDAIRPVTQRGTKQVRDRHRRHSVTTTKRRTLPSRFKPDIVGLPKHDLRCLLDKRNAIRVRNDRRERVQSVVLPVPVPPEIRTFCRLATALLSSPAA